MITTIRVSRKTRDALRLLARANGRSVRDVTEAAAERYRRQTLLERANRAYAAVQEDSATEQLWHKELNAWGVTSADGLRL